MARLLAFASAAFLTVGLVACSPADTPPPAEVTSAAAVPVPSSSPSSVDEPSPSATPSSLAPSPEASASESAFDIDFERPNVVLSQEQEEALDTVEEFFYYYDKAFEDPTQPIQELSEIAEGEYLGLLTALRASEAEKGFIQRGTAKYEVLRINDVQEIGAEQWVDVFVCSDLEHVWTADLETESRVKEPVERYQIFQLRLRGDELWRIPEGGNRWSSDCRL